MKLVDPPADENTNGYRISVELHDAVLVREGTDERCEIKRVVWKSVMVGWYAG